MYYESLKWGAQVCSSEGTFQYYVDFYIENKYSRSGKNVNNYVHFIESDNSNIA